MSLRDFFSRNNVSVSRTITNHVIDCDTVELENAITDWAKHLAWKFEDFGDFLELVGVTTPVKLSDFNKDDYSFKCSTALNSEALISLRFDSFIDDTAEIIVTEGEETRYYCPNSNYKKEIVPSVTLTQKNINRNGKVLYNYYSKHFCHRTLNLDATHILEVNIDEPDKLDKNSEILVLQNCADVEDYLLDLDNSLVVDEVIGTVLHILSFSEDDIRNSKCISISYMETIGKEKKTLSKILLTNGIMQEYAVFEDGETVHIFNNGNWKFSSHNVSIDYQDENKSYIFSVTGSKSDITNLNPSEILVRAQKKISELWKSLEE